MDSAVGRYGVPRWRSRGAGCCTGRSGEVLEADSRNELEPERTVGRPAVPAWPTGADGTTITRSITVGRPAEELYETWLDPDQVSRIVGRFVEVSPTEGGGYRWTVDGPVGSDFGWETRLVEERPGELLRWETTSDATLAGEGSIRFRPASGDRGTVVTLSVDIDPPGGRISEAALGRLGPVPGSLVGTALGRFKSLTESGQIPTLGGNPSARGKGGLW